MQKMVISGLSWCYKEPELRQRCSQPTRSDVARNRLEEQTQMVRKWLNGRLKHPGNENERDIRKKKTD